MTSSLLRSASDGSSVSTTGSLFDGGFEGAAPAYADQLNAALSTIFGARDASLDAYC